jgi:3-deoxy-D-manno-octulosonate 8-phosphate phosphatase (KDO 8-P phosphatase)
MEDGLQSNMIMNLTDASARARRIKLLLTDCDGVLTDTGVYYGAEGEVLKRFSIRDGMGVERLLKICNVETGIITGEISPSVAKRAEKLNITELHLGVKNKTERLEAILSRKNLKPEEIAYIGDDVNDLEVLRVVGLAACPADAMDLIQHAIHFKCTNSGGNGCFREVAEFIIHSKNKT